MRHDERFAAERMNHARCCRRMIEHRLGSFEIERAVKNGELGERVLLRFVEQLPRPIDRAAQRALPGLGTSMTNRENLEAAIQTKRELTRAENRESCRGQFDR